MSHKVLQTLLGRVPTIKKPAYLPNHSRCKVRNHVFPGIFPSSSQASITTTNTNIFSNTDKNNASVSLKENIATNSIVQGVLLEKLSTHDMNILDYFEGDEYKREMKQVYCINTNSNSDSPLQESWVCYDAYVYCWSNPIDELDLGNEWDYENFCKNHLNWYLKNVVEICKQEIDKFC